MIALSRMISLLAIALTAATLCAQDPPLTNDQLPPGHPPVDGSKFPEVDLDALRAQLGTGSIAVQAVQGTPGGPQIREAHVDVNLIHRGSLVTKLEGELDEFGVVVFENLPINPAVQPVVQIDYAGVTYQQVGTMMDANNVSQKIDVVCFETTSDIPDWHVQMWHVMLSHDPAGVRVTEVVVIDNAAERTWTGSNAGYDRPVTVSFELPESANDVQLGKGFHGWCCTTRNKTELVNHLPLMPEVTELNFSYVVPAPGGKATFNVKAPANVAHMMVIVPDDVAAQPMKPLELGGTDTIADTRVRYYTGNNIPRGDGPQLVLAGLSSVRSATAGTIANVDTAGTAKIVAAIGAGALVLIAIVYFLTRAGTQRKQADST